MSLYIKTGHFPKTCYDDCPCNSTHWCQLLNEVTEPMTGKRLENCPLIEVPPHGRLIDADAFEKHMSDTVMGDIRGYPYEGDTWDLAFSWLDHADTIIPADPEGGADG